MQIVNIRGTNGAGKSTIPLSMMELWRNELIEVPNTQTGKITVFPDNGWVALGPYSSKTGGLDRIRFTSDMRETLLYAVRNYPDFNILMEGFLASGIKSTYVNVFNEVLEINPKIQIIVLSFLPPLEVCLERVYLRNGGKEVSIKNVESKYNAVARNVSHFKEQGFISLKVDNTNTPVEKMLPNFLRMCDKYARRIKK